MAFRIKENKIIDGINIINVVLNSSKNESTIIQKRKNKLKQKVN